MATSYSPLTINRDLEASLRGIQTTAIRDEDARQTLGVLLQHGLQLEFATVPAYLSAVFSLTTANTKIAELILRAAIEEMLHMTAVANLMNAMRLAGRAVAENAVAAAEYDWHRDPQTPIFYPQQAQWDDSVVDKKTTGGADAN